MDDPTTSDLPSERPPEGGDALGMTSQQTVADHPRGVWSKAASTQPAPSATAAPAAPGLPLAPPGWPAALSDRYRPERSLGSGGMGRVYAAWDSRLTRHVAIKLLQGDDVELVQRFQREAQAQARIEHPGICRVYEVGEVSGQPFIAMQLVDGQSLATARGLST